MNINSLIFLIIVLLVPESGAGSTTAVLENIGASQDERLEQLGMRPDCFEEVFFERFSLLEASPEIALGVYEQRVDGKEAVVDTQHVVLLGSPIGGHLSPWMAQMPFGPCLRNKEKIEPARRCLDKTRCLQLWKPSLGDKDVLESVQIRFERRPLTLSESWRYSELPPLSETTFREILPGNAATAESSWPAVLFSNSEDTCSHGVFFASAQRAKEGLLWSLEPLIGVEVEEVGALAEEVFCMSIGRSNTDDHCVFLENQFVIVQAQDADEDEIEGIERCFDSEAKESWVFELENQRRDSGERIVAANIFANANRAVVGFARIFPWLPNLLDTVRLSQRNDDDCKAKWSSNRIVLPFACDQSGFLPKGLCPEVVTHELGHELTHQLLRLTTGFGIKGRKVLWEALADYFAVSLDHSLAGVYGVYCGEDLRSIQEGLWKPSLKRPTSFLLDRTADDRASKSLLISGALFDIAPALDLSIPLEARRRIVDRLAVLSLMFGGHDWQDFMQRFVELAELLIPDQVDEICSTLWGYEHEVPVLACSGRTEVAIFDIERVDINPLRVDGFLAQGKNKKCDPPVVTAGNHRSHLVRDVWSLQAHFEAIASNLSGGMKGSIEINCPGFPKTRRQPFTVRTADVSSPMDKSYLLRAPATEVKVNVRSGDSRVLQIAARDSSGGLTLITTSDPNANASRKSSVSYPPERIQTKEWRLEDDRLIGVGLQNEELQFDMDNGELLPLVPEPDISLILDGWNFEPSDMLDHPFQPWMTPSIPGHQLDPLINPVPWREHLEVFRGRFDFGLAEPITVMQSRFEMVTSLAEAKQRLSSDLESTDECDYDREIANPPGLIWNYGHEDEYTLLFFDSKCRVPPSCLVGPDDLKAALTCDGFLKVFRNGEEPLIDYAPQRYERVLMPEALASVDVDGDCEPELVVGPVALGIGAGAQSEVRALEWTGNAPVEGQWPILTELMPTVPPVFENFDNDQCPEVILAGTEAEVWKPSQCLSQVECGEQ